MSESELRTRKKRIDPRLRRADWSCITPHLPDLEVTRISATAVEEYPTADGPADYALCDEGRVQAVVEAKKLTVGPNGVLPQAERYSRGIIQVPRYQGKFGVPFLYSTNGEVIRFHDVRHPFNLSREVAGFHTPDAFREMLERDLEAELDALNGVLCNERMRPYQLEASTAIEQAIRGRNRRMLLAMATGTGKTVTMVNEVYRLMKTGVARRVLFLVDRRALAAQAVRTFRSFEAEPGLKFDQIYQLYSQRFQQHDFEEDEAWDPTVLPNSLLIQPTLGDAFVYVCTIQRMAINLFGRETVLHGSEEDNEDDADRLAIPIHAFDLIVADECHRGYSARELSVWRDTLNHFDAITIGLTATPAAHTVAFFKKPIYQYDYERAVREGYLVDYNAVRLRSNVRMEGVFLNEGEQIDEIDPKSGARRLDVLEDERAFEPGQVEKDITAPDSNLKILEEIKRYAEAHEAEYGRFPKSLIFAVNDEPHISHADQLVEQAREVFGRGEAFVAKITGRVDRPLRRIREFRNRTNPGIVVTVDLLTTGVDIPDLEFLVFLRPVKSRILFEQMLGRGTRKGERFPDKSHFLVFDCFDGTLLEYFRKSTGMTVEPAESDGKTIEQIIEEIWQNRDRSYNVRRLVKRLQRIDKEMSGDARELFARFIPEGDIGGFATSLPDLLLDAFPETMGILRNAEFQQLLRDYPRRPRTFIVAPSVTDTVESEWLIRAGAGKEYKPEDYLQAFATFVREHSDEVEAFGILINRPQAWGADPLRELRQVLIQAPEHFTEANLRRAYLATKHKALVDIISMVKNATLDFSPLLTAEERVDTAIERVTAGRALTMDQMQWMEYIRQHLVENLSIEAEDFAVVPVLSDRSGWGRADRVFDGQLTVLVADLNKELAAA